VVQSYGTGGSGFGVHRLGRALPGDLCRVLVPCPGPYPSPRASSDALLTRCHGAVQSLSLTGKLLYHLRLTDCFVVQVRPPHTLSPRLLAQRYVAQMPTHRLVPGSIGAAGAELSRVMGQWATLAEKLPRASFGGRLV
jgi:hypothetical protein